MTSETVQAAQRLLAEREAVGLRKYGTTVDRTDLSPEQWLQHAIEEASDLLLYLIRLRETMQPAPSAAYPIQTAPSGYGAEFLAFGRGGYYDSQGSWEKVVRHEDGSIRRQNGLPADEAEYWNPLPPNPCSSSPAAAPEDAERAAYLARWKGAPEWADELEQLQGGLCVWSRWRGDTLRTLTAGHNLLGSVRCEPRPTLEGGQGVEG